MLKMRQSREIHAFATRELFLIQRGSSITIAPTCRASFHLQTLGLTEKDLRLPQQQGEMGMDSGCKVSTGPSPSTQCLSRCRSA